MTLKTSQSAALSILLHGVFIFGLVGFTLPYEKQEVRNEPIKSYLFFEKSAAGSESVNNSTNMLDEVIAQGAGKMAMSAQPSTPEAIKLEIDSVVKNSLDKEKTTPTDATATLSSRKVQTVVSQYIQNLHSDEVGRISESSLNQFRKPKPLIDKSTPPSTNQRLQALSSSFAPKGSDIIVLSVFGPDETTIMLGDSCFTITQTALDDKIWKGSSVWTKSNSCGKYDKFDGQLQRSLNKYLQK
ncbi:MAG: hypothetical protein NWQ54_18350 [Paraglaciecola sp.]|uniref:hypothetical protein n=1 Tax=Paraglaciecola sp. TaxID=1920173 RepID=UPI00273D7BDD|nr:hypothetical protein [Paraglaciecola sp.]MDP5031292.1 hypothetical protein [Paraglaciecola sp.]MDP5132842.1 hypothetical protein [Paraglaciecola sp.]